MASPGGAALKRGAASVASSSESDHNKASRLAVLAAAGAAAAAKAQQRKQEDEAARTPRQATPVTPPRASARPPAVDLGTPVKAQRPKPQPQPQTAAQAPWEKTHKAEQDAIDAASRRAEIAMKKNFKEGQKFPTPPVAEATRAFYESLMEENPDSKIALKYCVEHGILSLDEHNKAYKKYKLLRDKGVFNLSQQLKLALMKKEKKRLLMKQQHTAQAGKALLIRPR